MPPPQPEPIVRSESARLHEGVAAIVGRRLTSVAYEDMHDSHDPHRSETLDDVEMAVILEFDDEVRAALSWANSLVRLGVDIQLSAASDPLVTFGVAADAGGYEQWRRLLGEQVVEVGAAWDVGETSSDDTLWAIRLSFAGGSSVTVALGGVRDRSAIFEPDNLVVIFREQEARAYQTPAGRTGAFGLAVAP